MSTQLQPTIVGPKATESTVPKNTQLLRDAILFAQAGKVNAARELLKEAATTDPGNELVWVWQASLAPTRMEALEYMGRALKINPDNKTVLSWIDRLRPSKAVSAPEWTCPLCEKSFATKANRCSYCLARHDLADLEAFGNDRDLRRDVLGQAIKRFEDILSRGPDFEAHLQLAIIHLNLRNSGKGIKHLREASRLRSDDKHIAQALAALAERKSVLIVDDSATVRTMISSTLENGTYRVRAAADGFEALASMGEELPDLVLLDVRMPGMDGYQVCRAIRQHGSTRRLPVIMISGSLMDRVRGRIVGCTGYLPKPFSKEQLLTVVQKTLPQTIPAHRSGRLLDI